VFGHAHRQELQYKTVANGDGPIRSVSASPGCLCRVDGAVPSYGSGLNDNGRAEIAKELDVSIKDVAEMETRIATSDQSLNARIGESGEQEWQDYLRDDSPNPEEIVIGMRDTQTRSKWLKEALGTLSEREQKIIRDRHLSYENVTLEELGKDLGVSKERVRQLEQRAMEKLKASMSKKVASGVALF
jgi:RNA polymerase sigma-32 factor